MENKEKPMLMYDSRGPDGNIFAILGQVGRELRRVGRTGEYNELWNRVNQCESYNDALRLINEYVMLVDVGKKEVEM